MLLVFYFENNSSQSVKTQACDIIPLDILKGILTLALFFQAILKLWLIKTC